MPMQAYASPTKTHRCDRVPVAGLADFLFRLSSNRDLHHFYYEGFADELTADYLTAHPRSHGSTTFDPSATPTSCSSDFIEPD
jgi:hypothetical protein